MKRFIPKLIVMLGVVALIPLQGLGGTLVHCVSESHTVVASQPEAEPSSEKVGVCCCRGPSSSNRSDRETSHATCCCSSSCSCHIQRDSDSRGQSPAEERLPDSRRRTVDQIVVSTSTFEGRPGSEGRAPVADADPFYFLTPDLCVLLCRYRL